MATLMQKDALLEGVFQALGYVINKNPNSKDRELFLNCNMKLNSIQIYNFINFFKKDIQGGSII